MKRNVAIFATALFVASIAGADDRWPAGSSGSFASYFSPALRLTDKNMGVEANSLLYEHILLNTAEDRSLSYLSINTTDYANAFAPGTGYCFTTPNQAGLVLHVYDGTVSGCLAGGGGAKNLLCMCGQTSPTTYGPIDLPILPTGPPAQHYWAETFGGSAPAASPSYLYSPSSLDWPRPLIRLDPLVANSCVAVEEVGDEKQVFFRNVQDPVIFARVNFSNDPSLLLRSTAVSETYAFLGWVKASLNNAGFEVYLDPAASTPETVLTTSGPLTDAFGFLWFQRKWYSVWIRDTVKNIAVILDLSAGGVSGTDFENWTNNENGGISLAMTTRIGGTGSSSSPNGVKSGAYSRGMSKTVNFMPFLESMATVGGNPLQYDGYQRVIAACGKTGATQNTLRFMVQEMSVVY